MSEELTPEDKHVMSAAAVGCVFGFLLAFAALGVYGLVMGWVR